MVLQIVRYELKSLFFCSPNSTKSLYLNNYFKIRKVDVRHSNAFKKVHLSFYLFIKKHPMYRMVNNVNVGLYFIGIISFIKNLIVKISQELIK